MNITNKIFAPMFALSLTALLLQPTISSSSISSASTLAPIKERAMPLTARGTRGDVCCSPIMTAEENNAPRRGFVRGGAESVFAITAEETSWASRRGTRDYDISYAI